eukprot:TRINITY_DN2270_c0_g1_i1.p1 TRINITY_DN2270_c0_g1~~TRINITY_DN2270_c0_g1_i1.p1  ORF type:complete len:804 (+),score=221.10 TRINITY_DN2270_c0_g1_i1:76-2487(+)
MGLGDKIPGVNKVVLLRHGESSPSAESVFAGWTDVPLSDAGVADAVAAGKCLKEKGFKFDVVFTSVLKRAIKTAWTSCAESDNYSMPVINTWRLNERHYGALQCEDKAKMTSAHGADKVKAWRTSYGETPPPLDKSDARHPGNDALYRNVPREALPATEALKDTIARVQPFWYDQVSPCVMAGKTVLVAAHGHSLRALAKFLEGLSEQAVTDLVIPPGVPLVYELDNNLACLKKYYLMDDAVVKAKMEAASGFSWTLAPHPVIPKPKKPVLVCILDGWGENKIKDQYNAVHSAKTPVFDKLYAIKGRARSVAAHGPAVGLPSADDMGNSEVGHNALGSGQVVAQGAKLVDNALASGTLFSSAGFKHISSAFAKNTVHCITLLSDGGVHSRYDQLHLLMFGLAERGAKKIRCHILTDGRDVADGSCKAFGAQLEKDLETLRGKGVDAQVASGGGRMSVTMDRYEADWGIVERGWKAHVLGEAPHKFSSLKEALDTLKAAEGNAGSDQFLPPFVIEKDGKPVGTVEDDDAVVLCNFRADRMVEMSKAFEYPDFNAFDRKRYPKTKFVGMMQYDGDLLLPANYLVDAPTISRVSGEFMVRNGIKTFACSETQKFGHVTFFWNGNKSGYIDENFEEYDCIESDKIVFDQAPKMKAREITDSCLAALKSGKYDMVRANYANPDMVGHTGNLAATVEACEYCDACVGELLKCVEEMGGRWLLTSDHGNADDMVQRAKKTNEPLKNKETGEIEQHKAHTLAPVPVCIGGDLPASLQFREDLPKAGLANVTGTFISLLGLQPPSFYEASLI